MPPTKIKMSGANYGLEGEYQISSDFIDHYLKNNDLANRELTYDIEIKVPDTKKSYYFDVETRHDFLTANVEMTLLAKDSARDDVLILISDS
jgi:hypothetical protein